MIREYANVLTRPQSYASPVLAGLVAKQLQQFELQYRVADETSTVTQQLYLLMEKVLIGGKQIHDANIVATMLAYQIPKLATLNVIDFERFKDWIDILQL